MTGMLDAAVLAFGGSLAVSIVVKATVALTIAAAFAVLVLVPVASLTTDHIYSYLNATVGSTVMARRVGIRHATSATTVKATVTRMKVSGSVGLTS